MLGGNSLRHDHAPRVDIGAGNLADPFGGAMIG
jgi:hypothetical protein